MVKALVCRGPHAVFAFVVVLAGLILAGNGTAQAASLVVDVETGQVISADAPNHLWYPASLTKMMTVYVALSEIEAGRLSFDDKIKVSSYAAGQSPVKFGLKAGQVITVREAINAAIVASANDAAVALAEKVSGSEEAFAVRMTAMARSLGMARTVFRNASGLPHDGQVTTARDLAVLATGLLRDYPKHYPLFNQRAVTIGKRSRGTVNSILSSYSGADGFKTGFTCGSGYNLVASATRDGRRLIGVVLGSPNRGQRVHDMTGLLNGAFAAGKKAGMTLAQLGNVITIADTGPAPTILSGGSCSAAQLAGEQAGTITSAARLSGWGVVFGAYPERDKAEQVLKSARDSLGPLAKGGRPAIVQKAYEGTARYSAMLVGLDQQTAGRACKALWEHKAYCLALSPQVLANPDSVWR
ncbi:D-alanyl-D-alanine carboxypeptidase family protein [Dongia deserti]|uniref:D-alanyl-D-alanine carboxypeptidase family protein n=1 Tax=Dongia deserti TaxID=2268030 RepID=UPI0013C3F93B|nr:D-alanyl-D-alanine carboxypeptidase family protein [Dongia deserti]